MGLRNLVMTGAVLSAVALSIAAGAALTAEPKPSPATYTADGKMNYPADYRTWVYLTSGFDMSYADGPAPAAAPTNSVFDNVFVDRDAYAAFQRTGTWPEGATMVLELRAARAEGSINKRGRFQDGEARGIEVHVKDGARFKEDGWAFFAFRGGSRAPAQRIAVDSPAGCHACHSQHAAVDHTFVQFYPTLMPKAREMGTLTRAYLAAEKAAPHP